VRRVSININVTAVFSLSDIHVYASIFDYSVPFESMDFRFHTTVKTHAQMSSGLPRAPKVLAGGPLKPEVTNHWTFEHVKNHDSEGTLFQHSDWKRSDLAVT
jgi:hypothetical protein